mgnify:CR=1 FL=1
MATKIELARLITYKAAWNYDQGRIDPKLTSMAKMYAARTAVEVADEAIQLLGGYGYMTEYEVERFYRDAKIGKIYEGTSNMQLQTIARQIQPIINRTFDSMAPKKRVRVRTDRTRPRISTAAKMAK